MSSYQKVVICGNLGQDPDVRYTPSGDCVTTLSVATSEVWRDKDTSEKRERTEWHRCVLWRRQAEVAGEYLKKGAKVLIDGKLQTRKWQDKAGNDRYSTEIRVDELKMLGSQSAGQGGGQSRNESAPQREAPPTPSFEDDDIPF